MSSVEVPGLYDRVREMCTDRLRDALVPDDALFRRQFTEGRWQATTSQEAITSSAIALIGLSRAGVPLERIGGDAPTTLTSILRAATELPYYGAIGLALWANAVSDGVSADGALTAMHVDLDDVRARLDTMTTMETAWLLSGLVHEWKRSDDGRIGDLATATARHLGQRRHAPTGLFRHSSAEAPRRLRLRTWVANFADQIYSVQALGFHARVADDGDVLALAEGTADRLVTLQGALGEWWWHYDPRLGDPSQHFPVYSVHQHAMAPMALAAVSAAGGRDYAAAIDKSVGWIDSNQSGASMVDFEVGTIWRDLTPEQSRLAVQFGHLRSLVGPHRERRPATTDVRVNRETRPYEWAWCLYADAILSGQPPAGHVV